VKRDLVLAPVFNSPSFTSVDAQAQRRLMARSNFVNSHNVSAAAASIAEGAPDVVYFWNLFGLGGLGLVAAVQWAGKPWVWHLMDAVPAFLCSIAPPHAPEGTLRPLASSVSAHLDGAYIACSERIVNEIEDAGISLGSDVTLVPNWIRGDQPQPRQVFFTGGELRVVYAGQIGPHKGTDVLIDAANDLLDNGFANFSIDIYGLGDTSVFEAEVNGSSLRDVVRFHPPRPHHALEELYDGYDVFAFPTWAREPFAFAPLEAAAHGCLALMSADSGNAEWFVDGVHCSKAARNGRAFARRLAAILEKRLDIAGVARRGQAAIWRDFHLNSVIGRIEGVLDERSKERRQEEDPREFYAVARLGEALIDRMIG
jgi:glycosyltransferase involved in cell wall biosynthesis